MFLLPEQDIPKTKKNEDWHKGHVLAFMDNYGGTYYSEHKEQVEKLFYAYLGILTKKERKVIDKTVVGPYGYKLGVEYMVYPLIESIIEQAIGIYLKRPLKRKPYSIDKDSVSRKLEHQLDLVTEQIFRDLNKEFEKETNIPLETEKPDLELPDDIEEYMQKDYMSVEEEIANDVTTQFLDVEKNKRAIEEALRYWLITDEAHSIVYQDRRKIGWRMPHPLNVITDRDDKKQVQDNQDYFYEVVYMSENEVLNTFSLSKEKKKLVKEYFSSGTENYDDSDEGVNLKDDKGWFAMENKINKVAVVEMNWKSKKTIKYKFSKNKHTGEEYSIRVKHGEKTKKTDDIRKIQPSEHRYCIMIGPDVVLDYGVREFRNSTQADPLDIILDSTSVYRQNPIGVHTIRSMASKLYKLQQFASEMLFELRLASKKLGLKAIIYDTAQTPKQYLKEDGQYGNALNRVMHHVKKDGFVFINSKDKGQRNSFNQFTSIDLSSKGLMQELINGLALIESLAAKWVGLSPESQGDIGQYASATSTERAVHQSMNRLEVYFKPFDEFIQTTLDKVIRKSKTVYKDNETTQFIFGDLKAKFIQFTPEYYMADIGMRFGYPNEEMRKKQMIDQIAQQALGNAQTPEMLLALIEILEEDSVSESKAQLKKSIAAMQKLQEERMKEEQAMMQEQAKAEQEEIDKQHAIEEKRIDKDIAVAKIYADNKLDTELDKNTSQERQTLAKIEADALANLNKS